MLFAAPLQIVEVKENTVDFDTAFNKLLQNEGGYSNIKADPGGETMFGITKATAKAHGYVGDMAALPLEVAKAIYKKSYWDSIAAEQLPSELRFHVFDAAVNSGTGQAIKWLQKIVGTTPDGILGPKTINGANIYEGNIVGQYNAQRLKFLTSLPTWPTFGKGWARRIADNLEV